MSQSVNLEDVGCPICLEILVEPITMPCKHTICKECFEKTIEFANLVCPMCKKRISNWCRKAKKIDSLVDVKLWGKIKSQFPDLVSARASGEGESAGIFQYEWTHDICENGVIRKEYEQQIESLRLEKEAQDRAEEELSRKLIEELLKEDESSLKESSQKNAEVVPSFTSNKDKEQSSSSQTIPKVPTKVKPNASMRQFVKPIQCDRDAPSSSSVSPEAKEKKNFSPIKLSGACQVTVEAVVERCDTPGSPSLLSDFFNCDDIGDFTPEFLDEQVKLEETFTREKEDEEFARRLQKLESEAVSASPSSSLKRTRSGPRQPTLQEIFSNSKKQKL